MTRAEQLYHRLVNDKCEAKQQWEWLLELKTLAPELYNKYMKSVYPRWEDVK